MMEDLTDMTQEEKYLQWMEEYFRQEGGDDLKRDLIIYSDTGKLLTVWASMVYGRVGMYVRNYMRNAHPEIDSEFEYGKFEDYSWELIQKLVEKWKTNTQNVEVQDVDIKYSQEDKELLLKDISARVPYGVKVECKWKTPAPNGTYGMICTLDSFLLDQIYNMDDSDVPFDEFKPYLYPLSSITPEQEKELSELGVSYGEYALHDDIRGLGIMVEDAYIFFEFCYKHHIDFLGLITQGLALDATNENIY